MEDAAALLAQFEQLNSGYFRSEQAAASQLELTASDDEDDLAAHTGESLEEAIQRSVIPSQQEGCAWEIRSRAGVGRYLVATRDLAPEAVVFSERPLIVAEEAMDLDEDSPLRSEMAQVASKLLRLPPGGPAEQLASPVLPHGSASEASLDEWSSDLLAAMCASGHRCFDQSAPTFEKVRWALGIATTNVHHRSRPNRGCLGLLASMMEHSCQPSSIVDVGPMESGSVLTLRTKRRVRAGETLSISYVEYSMPVAERQAALLFQHGFACECPRCVLELEITRSMEDAEQDARQSEPSLSLPEPPSPASVDVSETTSAYEPLPEVGVQEYSAEEEERQRSHRRLDRRLKKAAGLPPPLIIPGLLSADEIQEIWTFSARMQTGGEGWTRYGPAHEALFLHCGAPSDRDACSSSSSSSKTNEGGGDGGISRAEGSAKRIPLAQAKPKLLDALLSRVRARAAAHGLCGASVSLNVRCIELHTYTPGGGLTDLGHNDQGSELTFSVALSPPGDGGRFTTTAWSAERQCGVVSEHELAVGDAIVFASTMVHNVTVLKSGVRNSLVVELWKGATNVRDRHT
jgi:hypothetical protein